MRTKVFIPIINILWLISCGGVPSRPAGIPELAQWAGGPDGGHFIECSSYQNFDRCLIYDDQTGKLLIDREFVLRSSGRPIQPNSIAMLSFDSHRILLRNGDSLDPLPPPQVPSAAALLQGGRWLSCSSTQPGWSACSVYSFRGDTMATGTYAFGKIDLLKQAEYVDENNRIHFSNGAIASPRP